MSLPSLHKHQPRRPPTKKKIDNVLTSEYAKLNKLLDEAEKNEMYHTKQIKSIIFYRDENTFGSDTGENALIRTQHRYHLVKWRTAKKCIERRLTRLARRISNAEKKSNYV